MLLKRAFIALKRKLNLLLKKLNEIPDPEVQL
jgi:hypothetical protein